MAEKKEKKAFKSEKSRVKELYVKSVVPQMVKELAYKNVNEVPRLEKITINMRLGAEKDDSKKFNAAFDELGVITGQKPAYTVAKKSISNFKLREGQKVGAKTTLRGNHMYQFFDKLVSVALPRVRDFKGLPKGSFDGRGNYSFGIKEQLVFPEISYEKIDRTRGMDIIIVTTAKTDKEALSLLLKLGMPIKE